MTFRPIHLRLLLLAVLAAIVLAALLAGAHFEPCCP